MGDGHMNMIRITAFLIFSVFICLSCSNAGGFTKEDIVQAGKDCIVESPPEFSTGSQAFCDQGVFSKVKIVTDGRNFTADLEFNSYGFEIYSKKKLMFWKFFGGIVNEFYSVDATAHISFLHGGGVLSRCYPNRDRDVIICEDVLDERIARLQ